MIEILKSKEDLIKWFTNQLITGEANKHTLSGLLLECQDTFAQKNLVRVIKYCLCHLKIEERLQLESYFASNIVYT